MYNRLDVLCFLPMSAGASCHSNGLVAPLMFLLSSSAGSTHLTHGISKLHVCVLLCICTVSNMCVLWRYLLFVPCCSS